MENVAQPLHVVFFPAWYPSEADPMSGSFVKTHAEAVNKQCKVSVLYVFGEERRDGDQVQLSFQEEDGIPTLRVSYKKSPGKLGKLMDMWLYFSASLKGYKQLITQQGKADVHHIHVLTRASFIPLLMKWSGKIPYIITEHWSRYQKANRHQMKGKFHLWFTKKAIDNSYAVCPVNKELGDAMQEMGFTHPRYESISNVVDIERFKLTTEEPSLKRFLHVSCFDEKPKNTKGLLRAFQAAVKQDPSLFLTLVGDGPDWAESKAYARELGLDPYVDFAGLKLGDALTPFFHENRHFVLFSRYENQPVVLLEALACGMNIISSKVGGIAALLADGRGILVEKEDETALTDAILKASKGMDLADSQKQRQYILENHSFEAVANQYIRLYRAALDA
ncbi:MAG: glycosyltransferase [Bacteroidetes bacterium]|nr:MAG: glycosyltransferase [Bacteroidota bacterium]